MLKMFFICFQEGEEDEESSPKIKVPLTDGSLLLMLGSTQHDWLVRLTKLYSKTFLHEIK